MLDEITQCFAFQVARRMWLHQPCQLESSLRQRVSSYRYVYVECCLSCFRRSATLTVTSSIHKLDALVALAMGRSSRCSFKPFA